MRILFDIGGTKTRIAQDLGEKLGDVRIFDTQQNYEGGIEMLVKNCKELSAGNIELLVGGLPGVLNENKRSLFYAPNLEDWIGKDFVSDLENRLNSKVVVENDAALAGLGEAIFGAGRDFKIVAYITISTGIGGARIVDGKIDECVYGFEPGHQFLDIDSNIDFEGFVSGNALAVKYGKPTEDLMDKGAWDEIAEICAKGLINTVVYWSPQVIVLGGGVTHTDMFQLPKVMDYMKKYNNFFPSLPEVKLSELQDLSGIYGALAYKA